MPPRPPTKSRRRPRRGDRAGTAARCPMHWHAARLRTRPTSRRSNGNGNPPDDAGRYFTARVHHARCTMHEAGYDGAACGVQCTTCIVIHTRAGQHAPSDAHRALTIPLIAAVRVILNAIFSVSVRSAARQANGTMRCRDNALARQTLPTAPKNARARGETERLGRVGRGKRKHSSVVRHRDLRKQGRLRKILRRQHARDVRRTHRTER